MTIEKLDIDLLCQKAAKELTSDIFGYKTCAIRVRDARGQLRLKAMNIVDVDLALEDIENENPGISTIRVDGKSLAGKVALSGDLIELEDVQVRSGGDVYFAHRDFAKRYNLRSCYCVPLKVGNETLGTLALYSGDDMPDDIDSQDVAKVIVSFYPNELSMVRAIANHLALVVYYLETYSKWGSFFEIAKAVQDEEDRLRAIQHILTGITAREGLAFNRAIMLQLHSIDGEQGELKVLWSIGQLEKKDWKTNATMADNLGLAKLLTSNNIESGLQKEISGWTFKFDRSERLYSRLLSLQDPSRKRIFHCNLEDVPISSLSGLFRKLWSRKKNVSFAIVPMSIPRELKGFVYVDNAFDERAIEHKTVGILNTFADFAGSTIQRYEAESLKEQVVVEIGHHLKTPLVTVEQNLSKVDDYFQNSYDIKSRIDGRYWRLIEAAGRNAKIGLQMVRRIMKVDELASGTPDVIISSFPVETLFNDLINLFPAEVSRRLVIEVDKEISVRTSREFLRLAVFEILENAFKYSGNRVVYCKYCLVDNDNKVRIEIADSGPGVSEAAQPNIFRKHWRDKASPIVKKQVGLGLGLYLAHQYVTVVLGGTLDVEPNPRGGSIFVIAIDKKGRKYG